MLKINITYQVISQESASRGDLYETGFLHEDLEFNNKHEAMEFFLKNFGYYEQGNESDYYTVDPDVDIHTGNETYYGLHFINT